MAMQKHELPVNMTKTQTCLFMLHVCSIKASLIMVLMLRGAHVYGRAITWYQYTVDN